MSKYVLVRTDGTPLGKLPQPVPSEKPYKVLRFVEPTAAWPSGKLVMLHTQQRTLFTAAPPAVGLKLENQNV